MRLVVTIVISIASALIPTLGFADQEGVLDTRINSISVASNAATITLVIPGDSLRQRTGRDTRLS